MSQGNPKISTNRIRRKRTKAALAILAPTIGIGAVTLNPTPDIETAKQLFITIANVVMCLMLWDIYFDEELSKKTMKSILSELSFIISISIFTEIGRAHV